MQVPVQESGPQQSPEWATWGERCGEGHKQGEPETETSRLLRVLLWDQQGEMQLGVGGAFSPRLWSQGLSSGLENVLS